MSRFFPAYAEGKTEAMPVKKQSLKRQAALIALSGVLVKALGFGMRLWVSRSLGAEALGIMELASGVHALALAPAASGLPGAVSRMTAKAKNEEQRQRVLYAAKQLARRMALMIGPLFLLLSPWIARLLGDERTLPSLLCCAPCVLFVGLSCVYDGACLGVGWAMPPVISELGEQCVRLLSLFFLFSLIPALAPAWRAALPAFAGALGEGAGLLIAALFLGRAVSFRKDPALAPIRRALWAMSLPMIFSRLSHTGLRALSGMMIPRRLMAAGIPSGEAMSRLGMLNGMVMPLMFLPGLLAGALAMVGGPAAAKCESKKTLRRLFFRILLPALAAGIGCAGGLYLFSSVIAQRLYHLPELAPLIRGLCPMAVLLPAQQALSGMAAGLGLQKHMLRHTLLGAFATLLLTYLLTPPMGILGAGYAAMAGHCLTLLCTLILLFGRIFTPGDRIHSA